MVNSVFLDDPTYLTKNTYFPGGINLTIRIKKLDHELYQDHLPRQFNHYTECFQCLCEAVIESYSCVGDFSEFV